MIRPICKLTCSFESRNQKKELFGQFISLYMQQGFARQWRLFVAYLTMTTTIGQVRSDRLLIVGYSK